MAKTTFNLRVDEQLKQQFQAKCKDNGETATQVMERAMEAYINNESLQCNASPQDNSVTDSEKYNATCNDKRNDEYNVSNDDCNDSAKKSYDEVLARLEKIENDLYSNDKNIPNRAEEAFHNYLGVEDSLNDLWGEHNQHGQDIRDLKRYLEGLSCSINFIPQPFSSWGSKAETVETRPQSSGYTNLRQNDSNSYQNLGFDSKDSYSASQLASHLGISPRTVRSHLSKLSIGEVYKEQWELVERNPHYKLVRIE